ncbi:MAG: hypothetical protein RL211_1256 [Pseudomonadota bacterium]
MASEAKGRGFDPRQPHQLNMGGRLKWPALTTMPCSLGTPVPSPRYSLVIATLDDCGDLGNCLASLVALNPGPEFEVIVVDQNDDTQLIGLIAQFSKKLNLVHEHVPYHNASRARNSGARLARGEWLAFPDDDCELMPDVLNEAERLTVDSRVMVVTGQTIDPAGVPNVLRWRQEPQEFTCRTMFGCLTEATLFVRRDIFLAVQGFDQRFGPGGTFPAAEGIDLMNRLFTRFGDGRACYSPRIRMRHPTKIPPWNAWAVGRFHRYALGDGALIAKNPQSHMLSWGLRTAVTATLQALTFRGWRSLAYAARLTGLFAGFIAFHMKSERN